MSDFNFVKISEAQSGLFEVVISRPDAMNALNPEVLGQLSRSLLDLEQKKARVVIFSGEGRAFVAGADISKMKDMNAEQALEFSKMGHGVFNQIEKASFVSIAMVNGFCLGGGLELALSCDLMWTHSKAKFGLPEVGLGLIPGFGGTQRLQKKVGETRAKWMALSGEMFSAKDLKDWGLFCEFTEPEELAAHVMGWAERILKKGPSAQAHVKSLQRSASGLSMDQGLSLEQERFSEIFKGKEHLEGLSAFLEKREAQF